MLHQFLTRHRNEIISRARLRLATRTAPRPTEAELEHWAPVFVEQLADTLSREQETQARPTSEKIAQGAQRHGAELRKAGFTVAQVVHDYGDVRQVVTELAIELQSPISADELKTLNQCLDEAIAHAVTEYAHQRDLSLSDRGKNRLDHFAHELRNLLGNATLAFEVLKVETVGLGGSTGGALLGRSLARLGDLVDGSLAEARLEAGLLRREHVLLSDLIQEVEVAAAIQAKARSLQLTVSPVEAGVAIDVDRQRIAAALANLLQNAFKFSRPNGHIALRTDTTTAPGRVLIEVEDQCGGLPSGVAKDLFLPFEQRSTDRSSLGLGLAIASESVATNGGKIRARSLTDRGCVFTIDLPCLPRQEDTATGALVVVTRDLG
jgi:signal transduction histidine kinase